MFKTSLLLLNFCLCVYMPYKDRNFNLRVLWKCYLLFVWLVVIGFRQNYFHILPNFGDFGAKMSFFRYVINQKRIFFLNNAPPPCSKTPLLSEMCIYITSKLCKWGLGTRGNDVLQTKMERASLQHMKYHYSQRKITSMVNFLIKSWNFVSW